MTWRTIQRKVVYEQRNELMDAADISETIKAIRHDVVASVLDQYIPPQSWMRCGISQA